MTEEKQDKVIVDVRVEAIVPMMMAQAMDATQEEWSAKAVDLAERIGQIREEIKTCTDKGERFALLVKHRCMVISLASCETYIGIRGLIEDAQVDLSDPMFGVRQLVASAIERQQTRDYCPAEGDTRKALEDALALLEVCAKWLPHDMDRKSVQAWIDGERKEGDK